MEEKLTGILKEAQGAGEWMHDSSGYDIKDTLEGLAEDNGDVCEVIVDLYLDNGMKITLHNHCRESVLRKQYMGDGLFVYDGVIYVERTTDNGEFHQGRISPEHLSFIDQYTVDVDWHGVKYEQLDIKEKWNN